MRSHLSNAVLRVEMKTSDLGESRAVAWMLSRIAEYDERRLYLEDGYPSMYAYCKGELKYTEPETSKRIFAARTARKFPSLFDALADGRLHLTGLVMLARHLTPVNLNELLAAASRKTADEIALLIAERFPRPDLPERLEVIAPSAPVAPSTGPEHSARNVEVPILNAVPSPDPIPIAPPATIPTQEHSARNVEPPPRGRMTPLAPQKFGYQFTGDEETHSEYEKFRERMGHEIPSGAMALVFKAALKLANAALDKKQFAVTDRPRRARETTNPRYVPAKDKREVAERDEGRCTFVSETGKRCGSRCEPQFHHDDEFARGGPTVATNLRLLCRAHNQHEAERSFGAEFIERRKQEARAMSADHSTTPPT